MGLLDDIGNIAKQFTAGQADASQVHSAYDQVAQEVPHGALADGLAQAFNSDQTPPFGQMLSRLFQSSNPEQKAGILNRITTPSIRRS